MSVHDETSTGIVVRSLDSTEQIFEATRVLAAVWGGDDGGMPANLLRALAHSGNYVVGLFDADRMIGVSAAFFAEPAARSMHSHVTGILPEYRQQGLGRILKEHQRTWAFARSVGHITWTFDPLVARNAHFNLRVLGAQVTEYLVDHYGPMQDVINEGDETDRLLVSGALAAPRRENPDDAEVVASVRIPRDIESMREDDPVEAARWRHAVREQFLELYAQGLAVGGFRDGAGYLFVRAAEGD